MRQEIINIYQIHEHPDKDACFEWIRNNWYDLGDYCVSEMITSLKALAEAVNGTLDYSLSIVPDRGEHVSIKDYDKGELKALYKKRDECPLTGMCYDYDIINGLYNGELCAAVTSTLHNEGEYLYSDEGLREMCEANEYEFLKDGSYAVKAGKAYA